MSTVTFQSIVKTLDSTHAVDLRGGVRIPANVPAQYVGSDYWLWIGESNGNPMVWDNTPEELKCYNHPSGTNIWGETLIPIQNTNIGKMSFNLTAYPYTSDHKISIFLYKIIDNVITLVKTVSEITTTVVNQNYEVSCDVDTDYIGVKHAWFSQSIGITMKNIDFELGVTYAWQSVPSISGKNGILLLSTIQSVYLNNGDPVNNALESYIDFIDDSKVAVLVEQEIDDLTKVTVKYVVPTGTYEYIKLVYKTGSAPTSVTDGTAVDILQAAKKVILSGIADGSTYFFKIFTDITESEPYEFTTVRPVGENFFTIDFSSDGRDTMRYNASKTIHVQANSTYSMRDVDYYTAQGALADPISPSNPTYTISNGEVTTANNTQFLCWAYDVTANQRIIPANCTLWFEFDAYFLNSEGYLDWRMYNDQGVEKIYWCWDTRYAFSVNQWYNCKLEATITNGFITTIKYYVDNNMVEQDTRNIHMLCIDEDNPIPLYFITFETTRPTKLKNMKIYWE